MDFLKQYQMDFFSRVNILDIFPTALKDPVFIKFINISNFISIICWFLALVNDNYSMVDRIWPILPAFYAWGFVFTAVKLNPGPDPDAVQISSENRREDVKNIFGSTVVLESENESVSRLVIMAIFMTLWCCRLVYNFWRKGGYSNGHEDYRWVHVRKMFNYPATKLRFHTFAFVFIAFIQNWLLMGLAVPLWLIQTNKYTKRVYKMEAFNWLDAVLCLIWCLFFSCEVIGDRQQFKFQTNKYKYLSLSLKGKKNFKESSTDEEMADIKRGFLTRGLWKFSRHPNFFGELGMWWTIAAFSISSQLSDITRNFHYTKILPFNYAFISVACLTLLFHKSTELTEKITLPKYPEYNEYIKRVSRITIGFPGKMDQSKKE